MSTIEHKKKFLRSEYWVLSWSASVSTRNKNYPVYSKSATAKQKKEFRNDVTSYVDEELIPQYLGEDRVSENEHLKNIVALAKRGSDLGSSFLHKGQWRIGVAQKLLNLQLKYLWCSGMITSIPPHCPVDGIIISKTNSSGKLNWTEINDIEEYKEAIESIRIKANEKNLELSDWELEEFERRS